MTLERVEGRQSGENESSCENGVKEAPHAIRRVSPPDEAIERGANILMCNSDREEFGNRSVSFQTSFFSSFPFSSLAQSSVAVLFIGCIVVPGALVISGNVEPIWEKSERTVFQISSICN